MEDKVFSVFVEALGVDPSVDRAILVYSEYPGWDSVAHMTLVAGLEDAFDCMLEMDDIIDMSSFDKAVSIMAKYG